MEKNQKIGLRDVVPASLLLKILLAFTGVSVVLSIIFIESQAFEWLYAFSRSHEDWELDEYILAATATLISMSVALLVLSVVLVRRMLKMHLLEIEMQKRMDQVNKMESMGTMLGGVAHSVNNHLQPIITISEMIRDDITENGGDARDIQKVSQAAMSASAILRNIMDFTRTGENESASRESVSDVISRVVELASYTCPSAVRMKSEIDAIPAPAAVSSVELEVVVLNLVSNSIDAIEGKNGEITVSLHVGTPADALPGMMNIEVEPSVGWACLSVSDTGKGMTEEEKRRIFEPFFTSKDVGKGTGLGMSEVYSIVSRAGGFLDIASVSGEGATVDIWIPLQEKAGDVEEKTE